MRKDTNMTLPAKVIADDHQLEDAAGKASEQLAYHRWHWTLDETNAKRVSVRAYARAVGRSQPTIYATVEGYATWAASDRGSSITNLGGYIQLAGMSGERAAATEAVAKALGNTIETTARGRRAEVREVLTSARDAAERKGTDVHDEIERHAKTLAQGRQASAERRAARPRSVLYAKLELRLSTAQRALSEVLVEARSNELDEEVTELVLATIANIKALLGLIDLALAGNVEVDWDAELARLGTP
jgi:hypothetical protein